MQPHNPQQAPEGADAVPQAYTQDAALNNQSEDLRPVASVPWVGIAAAVHVIVLVIAWFVLPAIPLSEPPRTLSVAVDSMAVPPLPVQEPEKFSEFPIEDDPTENESEDVQITPDPEDTVNSDNTDDPTTDLAKADNNDLTDSPHPEKRNPSSSVGLGGPAGGGGGGGGEGGFKHRRSKDRSGTKKHPDRRDGALKWLADHQNGEGYWSAAGFSQDSVRANARKTYNRDFVRVGDPNGDKGWDTTVDIGLTGLAILAFTGDGQSHKVGRYRDTVRRALMYLRKVQNTDGCIGPKDDDHFVYNHAIATMAMAELYGLDSDVALRPLVVKAVDFIIGCQNPGLGWRYGVRPNNNDSSVTGWMVLTLHVAEMAGITFDKEKCYGGAVEWFKAVTIDVGGYPKTGYDTPASNSARLRSASQYENVPSMDSIHIMSMLFMDKADIEDPVMRSQAGQIVQQLPEWKLEKLDYYYWYYASLALYQMGGSAWDKWEKPMSKVLLDSQRGYSQAEKGESAASLDEHGSWDPIDAWGSAGGRVYSTAINCLTLQVWDRYERNHKKK